MLSVDNVSFSYSANPDRTGEWALSDVSLTVAEGEFLGIAGPTGSGKSTLAQVLCGLAEPARGSVRFDGEPLAWNRKGNGAYARVGMAFQYPERQLFGASVAEDVAFGPTNLGASPQEASRRAADALERVGLDPERIGEASPFQLSGGQQRKVALAGVLAMQPSILVLDEPAAGLDPVSHNEIMELVSRLHSRDGLGIVMISHSMQDIARLCQRVTVLHRGRIFTQGSPDEVFANAEAIESIGLALPRALDFARKMGKAGMPLPSENSLCDLDSLADAIASLFGNGADRTRR